MAADEAHDWLVSLYEEHGATLHRLTVLLGAEDQSGRIVRSALLALQRRSHRLIDPIERVYFLQEHVVHLARAVRPALSPLIMPRVDEPRQDEILRAVSSMAPRSAELLIVSHYLAVFGPDLAGIMRQSVRGANLRLETALEELRAIVGAPTPGSQPGVIESLSQELTAALRSAARLTPVPEKDMLVGELEQIAEDSGIRFGPPFVVTLTIAAVALGLLLAALTRNDASPQVVPTPEPVVTATPTTARSLPATMRNTPLYYVDREGKLYRELRDLQATGNLLRSAVEALFTLVPLDPDYTSGWGPGQLLNLETDGTTVTIDLSGDAYADLTSPVAAQRARDQMIYTVAELVGNPDLSVHFRADGGTAPPGFDKPEGYQRSGLEPMAAVWISSPRNRAQLTAGTVSIIGTVKPGVGVPIVRITEQETGQVILETSAQTTAGVNVDGWRVWTVSTTLPKGRLDITVTVTEEGTQVKENKSVVVS